MTPTEMLELARTAQEKCWSDVAWGMVAPSPSQVIRVLESYIKLEAENKKLKDALNRLGSFEAITAPYVSSIAKTMESEELIARISFARAAALGEKP